MCVWLAPPLPSKASPRWVTAHLRSACSGSDPTEPWWLIPILRDSDLPACSGSCKADAFPTFTSKVSLPFSPWTLSLQMETLRCQNHHGGTHCKQACPLSSLILNTNVGKWERKTALDINMESMVPIKTFPCLARFQVRPPSVQSTRHIMTIKSFSLLYQASDIHAEKDPDHHNTNFTQLYLSLARAAKLTTQWNSAQVQQV